MNQIRQNSSYARHTDYYTRGILVFSGSELIRGYFFILQLFFYRASLSVENGWLPPSVLWLVCSDCLSGGPVACAVESVVLWTVFHFSQQLNPTAFPTVIIIILFFLVVLFKMYMYDHNFIFIVHIIMLCHCACITKPFQWCNILRGFQYRVIFNSFQHGNKEKDFKDAWCL